MRIIYSPTFLRQLKKLNPDLQSEAFNKIKIFEKNPHTKSLNVHKLKGRLLGKKSFWVNYSYRIIFTQTKDSYNFLEIGDHDMYR